MRSPLTSLMTLLPLPTLLLAGLLLVACGAEPGLYYETTGLLHRPVAAADTPALVAAVAKSRGERAITVRALDGRRQKISGAALKTLDPTVLQALFLVLSGDYAGAEIDLLVQSAAGRSHPITALVDRKGNVELQPGRPGAMPATAAIEAAAFPARHGIGPLREDGAKWGAPARHALDLALGRLDRGERVIVEGLPWIRARAERARSDRGAQYVQENCRASIQVYDRAFAARSVQFTGPVERPLPGPMMSLLHEIGHALHNRPGRLAFCDYEAVLADRNRRAAAFGVRVDAFNALVPRANRGDGKARAEIARLQGPIAKEQAAIGALDQRVEQALARARRLASRGPVIEAYVRAVGEPSGPTDYGRSSETESFAEAFALYKTDPAALKRAMPKAHAFFAGGKHLAAMAARR